MRKRKTLASRGKESLRRSKAGPVGRTKRSVAAGDLSLHLERIPRFPLQQLFAPPPASRFKRKVLEASDSLNALPLLDDGENDFAVDKDCILSQDFFCESAPALCRWVYLLTLKESFGAPSGTSLKGDATILLDHSTPDYITPEIPNNLNLNKENVACPKSPEKSVRNKKCRQDYSPCISPYTNIRLQEEDRLKFADSDPDVSECTSVRPDSEKKKHYVSQSAVALRYRAMPPPCIRNPYIISKTSTTLDVFGDRPAKYAGFSPSIGGDGISRYRTDFHEIEQIGSGNFSHVYKVLKRIDGCLYAVKHSMKQFHNDIERKHALREVQALAAIGYHVNIVGYHTAWFENEKLYIQMELCDRSLSNVYMPRSCDILDVLYQMSSALHFMHDKGIAHMDVKPENIYVKCGVYKLGDFGCATLTDRSLSIEEGDSRYMPQEVLKDKYEHLDKVDIFSLGAATYELVKGSPLPDSGPLFCNLREGKIPLLPGYSMQFQSVLKAMMDPDPAKRPSAKEVMENPIFEKIRKNASRSE